MYFKKLCLILFTFLYENFLKNFLKLIRRIDCSQHEYIYMIFKYIILYYLILLILKQMRPNFVTNITLQPQVNLNFFFSKISVNLSKFVQDTCRIFITCLQVKRSKLN